MFGSLYYFVRYRTYMHHPQGIQRFADRCVAACLMVYLAMKKRVATQIRVSTERVSSLMAERDRLDVSDALTFELFVKHGRRLAVSRLLFLLIQSSEIVLNYFAMAAMMSGHGVIVVVGRISISIVLTFSATVVSEMTVAVYLPHVQERNPGHAEHDLRRKVGLTLLLLAVESAIGGVSTIRARDIEGSSYSLLLGIGFVVLAVVLPLIAGWMRHDSLGIVGPYKKTARVYAIETAIERERNVQHARRHKLESTWQDAVEGYWNRIADFRTHKEVYNDKRGVSEPAEGKYWGTKTPFAEEATRQRAAMYDELQVTGRQPVADANIDHGEDRNAGSESAQAPRRLIPIGT